VLQLIDPSGREPLLTATERAALHAAPWLAALPAPARHDLLHQYRVSTVRAEAGVASAASGLALCGVASGALGIGLRGPGAEVVDYLPPGTWLADAGALVEGGAHLEARAHRRATVVSLPADLLHELARRHACLDTAILGLSGGVAARLLRILEELATCSLKVRLARCLLRLVAAFGVAERDGLRLARAINQGRLARLVRASRQRLNLELGTLQAAGVVRVGKDLVVTDLRALRAMAPGDARAWARAG
jgi:CRP-like cAMP-binding protein